MIWMVFARKPVKPSLFWNYDNTYFPRKFNYKSDADKLAKKAKQIGGIGVVVKPFLQNEFDLERRLAQLSNT